MFRDTSAKRGSLRCPSTISASGQRFQSIQRTPAGSLLAGGMRARAGPTLGVIPPGNRQRQDGQDYQIFRMLGRSASAGQPNPANPIIPQILILTTPRLKAGAREVGAAAGLLGGGVGLSAVGPEPAAAEPGDQPGIGDQHRRHCERGEIAIRSGKSAELRFVQPAELRDGVVDEEDDDKPSEERQRRQCNRARNERYGHDRTIPHLERQVGPRTILTLLLRFG